MRVLFLSPQSFYIERGTPIAVKLVVSEIARLKNTELDLLTYPVGNGCYIKGIKHYRSYSPINIKEINAGFSFKKVFLDLFFTLKALRLVFSSLIKGKKYQVIHAVEESVFIALICKYIFRINYVYDMDSCLRVQILEKYPKLNFLSGILCFLEKLAIRNANTVLAVCSSLEDEAKKLNAKKTIILSDISLHEIYPQTAPKESIRETLQIDNENKLVVYVGNLEKYQGIDLLIESAKYTEDNIKIIIIGGSKEDLEKYKSLTSELNLKNKVFFLGPKPIKYLHYYLEEANFLASPRINGNNTPMKIYSYMNSGTPIIATNIVSHTQVLDNENSLITDNNSKDFANGINSLAANEIQATELGNNAKATYKNKYSLNSFKNRVQELYSQL